MQKSCIILNEYETEKVQKGEREMVEGRKTKREPRKLDFKKKQKRLTDEQPFLFTCSNLNVVF